MMQFYKKREFGNLVSDTFLFFKLYGKNYFKNYFLINGILLILLVALFVFGYREFFMQLFAGNTSGNSYYFEQYFEDNVGMLVTLVVALFMLVLAVSIISYSFPIFYMKRVSEKETLNVKPDEIVSDIKQNIGRILILILGLVFIVTPAFLVVLSISYVLVLVVIGFFLLFLLVPTCMNIVNFLLFDYLQTKKGFFESLSFAIRAQFSYKHQGEKSPYWKYWGTTATIYFIIYIVTLIFTLIPMFFLFGSSLLVPSSNGGFEQNPMQGTMGIIFFLIYGVSMLVSFTLMNVLLVASGLMYYDNRTDLHQQVDLIEIDSIGTNEA